MWTFSRIRHPFLRPISHERGGIGIDGRAGQRAQAAEQFCPQFVVGRFQASQGLGAKTQQESSQRVPMREIVQAQQGRDESVVDQALSVLDPAQTRHDGKDVGQKQVGRMVSAVIVVGPVDEHLQEAPNLQTPAKCLEKTQPAEASETAFFEGKMEFPRAFGHTSQPYLKGRFVKSPNYIDETRYSYAPTALP